MAIELKDVVRSIAILSERVEYLEEGGPKITLTDFFAGLAMSGYIARNDGTPTTELAEKAYIMAKMMLGKREEILK